MNQQKRIFRVRSRQNPKQTVHSSSTETPSKSKGDTADCIATHNDYGENKGGNFEVMNIKIVIYGLTGLVCEEDPKKKQKSGKKQTIFPAAIGISRRDIEPLGPSSITNRECQEEPGKISAFETTTVVVSCQKNGINKKVPFETFLPSLPFGNPIATSLNKSRYTATWPPAQSILQQEDGAKDRSAFAITRSMQQATFAHDIGIRSNYCHETIELGINISRGTEMIRLGTATIVVNGEEEDEVEMNVSATPFVFDSKKLKKKKNKYGYFSDDSTRRFSLDQNSVLKVGVQVIPEETVRRAREKDNQKIRQEGELNKLLDRDKVKTMMQKIGNDIQDLEKREAKTLPMDRQTAAMSAIPEHKAIENSFFPNVLCGSIPTSWVPNFFRQPETEPDIPTEIIADDDVDQLIIRSLISSVSEATEDLDVLDGEQLVYVCRVCIDFCTSLIRRFLSYLQKLLPENYDPSVI